MEEYLKAILNMLMWFAFLVAIMLLTSGAPLQDY